MNKYSHKVLLVSDMHYTTDEGYSELKKSYPAARASAAAGDAFGYTQREKIEFVKNDLNREIGKGAVDAVFVLGDLSIDDYSFRNLPLNYCAEFKRECMDKLNCRAYAIPGNHDSYTNEQWKEIFGLDRQFSVKIGDTVFILLDTFADYPAKDASGSKYTGADFGFLEREIGKYTDEKIIIMSHYFPFDKNRDVLERTLEKYKGIVCLFDAHTHVNKVYPPTEKHKYCQINIGGYSGEIREDNNLYFDRFDEAWAWGYEVFEWNENEAHIYHVKPPRKYTAFNGIFDFKGAVENEIVLKFRGRK